MIFKVYSKFPQFYEKKSFQDKLKIFYLVLQTKLRSFKWLLCKMLQEAYTDRNEQNNLLIVYKTYSSTQKAYSRAYLEKILKALTKTWW